jgi:hypothetical protein
VPQDGQLASHRHGGDLVATPSPNADEESLSYIRTAFHALIGSLRGVLHGLCRSSGEVSCQAMRILTKREIPGWPRAAGLDLGEI